MYGTMDPEYWEAVAELMMGAERCILGLTDHAATSVERRGTIMGYFCNGYISIFVDCFQQIVFILNVFN